MRISRESIFSDWNNFDVFGITSKYFSDKFIYNPWSIVNYITKVKDGFLFTIHGQFELCCL